MNKPKAKKTTSIDQRGGFTDDPAGSLQFSRHEAFNTYSDEQEALLYERQYILRKLKLLYMDRWIVLAFVAFFTLAGLIYALSLSDTYTAKTVLSPVPTEGGIPSGIGGASGIASLAGITFGNASNHRTLEAIEILGSRSFIESFVIENAIGLDVIAAIGWDSDKDTLIYNESLLAEKKNEWGFDGNTVSSVMQRSGDIYKEFKKLIQFSVDGNTGFLTIELEFYSPLLAKKWIDGLVYKINRDMQKKDAEDAKKLISYLKKQIEKTNITNMHAVFFNLIEDQTKKLMLTQGDNGYVFKVINEAGIPYEKSGPFRFIIIVSASILGFLSGIFFVIFKESLSRFLSDIRPDKDLE